MTRKQRDRNATVGELLWAIQVVTGWDDTQLAKQIGTSQSTVSKHLREGGDKSRSDTRQKVETYLDLLNDVLSGSRN